MIVMRINISSYYTGRQNTGWQGPSLGLDSIILDLLYINGIQMKSEDIVLLYTKYGPFLLFKDMDFIVYATVPGVHQRIRNPVLKKVDFKKKNITDGHYQL